MVAKGDFVQVVKSVQVKGRDVRGQRGVVVEAWEPSPTEWGCCMELATDATVQVEMTHAPVEGYFTEEELKLLRFANDERRAVERPLVEGDCVQVVRDVVVKGASALHARGVVTSVWVICETDPACCCAELATDATVTVALDQRWATLPEPRRQIGYFAEDEIEIVRSSEIDGLDASARADTTVAAVQAL